MTAIVALEKVAKVEPVSPNRFLPTPRLVNPVQAIPTVERVVVVSNFPMVSHVVLNPVLLITFVPRAIFVREPTMVDSASLPNLFAHVRPIQIANKVNLVETVCAG